MATQTSTVVNEVSADAKPYLYGDQGILPRAQALSQQPLNLPDYKLASFSQPQMQAFNLATQGIGGYLPALNAATSATNQGIASMGQGTSLVNQALGQAQPYQYGSAYMGYGSTMGYDPRTAYRDYMNPYINEVINQSEQDIARQGKMQEQQLRSQAVAAGAFGGSRSAVAERELGRNVADQQARTSAGLRASAYEQAQNQAQQNFENQMQRRAAYASLLGNLGTAYGQLGLQGAQTYGQIGQGLGSLGTSMGALGELGQTMGIRDVGTLMDIGNVQQAQNQSLLDVQRQNAYQDVMAPYQQLGYFSDIYQGMPIGGMQTTSQPGPSMISQLGGLAYGIASLQNANRQTQ